MLQGVYCLSSSALGSTSLRTSDFSNAVLKDNSDIGRLLCCIIRVMSSELDVYWVKGGPCRSSSRCDSLLKIKSKCYILYVLRHLVFKILVHVRWYKVSGDKQWALLIHNRTYHIIHCWTFSLLWARAVFCWMCSLCLTASSTTSSSLCRTLLDNCNLFEKSPCQVAGGRSHNSGLMIPTQMLMLKWTWYPHSWIAWD